MPERRRLDSFGRRFVRYWEDQEALEKPAEKLSAFYKQLGPKLPGGQKTVNFLNGTYLGHPLHPLLTDLPIGAFTFAMMFDMATTGRKEPSKAATTLLAAGLAAVPITALAGSLDWQHTNGKTRRVGFGHVVLNGLGATVMAASLVSRLRGTGPTRTLNYLGNGTLTLSAYLGGHLVLEALVGTKHEAEAAPPSHFEPVLPDAELKEQTLVRAEANGYPVALYRRFGHIYAIADVCPHLGCSLAEGSVESDAIVCGCHGSKFALDDGAVLQGPSAYPTEAYATRVVDGMIEIAPMSGVNR
jgi:nitrite reductase/ring-hydroxylating ferredoxin subunit/uncharacterized membrane protein